MLLTRNWFLPAGRAAARDSPRIEQLGRELDHPGPIAGARALGLRGLLYGLEAVVSLHFEKEEEIYLPILDEALDPDASAELFEGLEAAASA